MKLPLNNDRLVFGDIVEQIADVVLVTDKHGNIEYANPAFERSSGYSTEEVLGKNPNVFKSGKQSNEYYQLLWMTILAGKSFNAKVINKKKNGELYVVDQTISPILNEKKEIIHFVSTWKDVTKINRIEERMNFEKEKLEEIIGFDENLSKIRKIDQLADYVVANTRKILDVDKCSIMLVDRQSMELYIKSMAGFEEDAAMRIKVLGSIAQRAIVEGQSLMVNDLGNDERFKDLSQTSYLGDSFMIVPIRSDRDVIGIINVAGKNSDSKGIGSFDRYDLKILNTVAIEMAKALENISYYTELQYLTVTDPLTNIHNYRHFVNSLDNELKRLKRFPKDLCLSMIDIDGFKSYNDQLGHLAGDELLRKIGQEIQSNLREVDVLCRYGGDEFVAIFPETNKEGAVIITEKIREFIGNIKFQKQVTLSIGVAQYKAKMTMPELILNADEALYQAKKQGKNRVCVFGAPTVSIAPSILQ